MNIIDLSIPYNKKDELKPLGIKWNNDKRIWYFECTDEMKDLPEELDGYRSVHVDVSYDDKDVYKSQFPSMSFDRENKSWKMSKDDFEKMKDFSVEN